MAAADEDEEELDWDGALARWRTEVADTTWVTLAEAEAAADVSRSALRTWYRKGDVPSRLVPGPHGEQRLVPLDAVLDRTARIRGRRRQPVPAPGVAEPDNLLAELLAEQLRRAEARAERAEAELRDALARAAAAEAELRVLRQPPRPR